MRMKDGDKVKDSTLLARIIEALDGLREPATPRMIYDKIISDGKLEYGTFNTQRIFELIEKSIANIEGIFSKKYGKRRWYSLQVWGESPERTLAREIATRLVEFQKGKFDLEYERAIGKRLPTGEPYKILIQLIEDGLVERVRTGWYRVREKKGGDEDGSDL